MTVAELIEKLQAMPQDMPVYRWDSERSADGTETVLVTTAELEEVGGQGPLECARETRVVII